MRDTRYRDYYNEENYGLEPCDDPTAAEIYEELNTREHVPNKIEARKIRQERAKKGNRNRR